MVSLSMLSDSQREKELLIGSRGFEYCSNSGKRIIKKEAAILKGRHVFLDRQNLREWEEMERKAKRKRKKKNDNL